MPVTTRFVKNISVYKPDTNPPEIDHEIGSFVFRRPNVIDERDIGIERARLLRGVDVDTLDYQTRIFLEFGCRFPRLVEQAPEGFDWKNMYSAVDVEAILSAFAEGMKEIVANGEIKS